MVLYLVVLEALHAATCLPETRSESRSGLRVICRLPVPSSPSLSVRRLMTGEPRLTGVFVRPLYKTRADMITFVGSGSIPGSSYPCERRRRAQTLIVARVNEN